MSIQVECLRCQTLKNVNKMIVRPGRTIFILSCGDWVILRHDKLELVRE